MGDPMSITLNGTTGITTPALDSSGPLTSLGIDDNATSTAITIDASQNVGIGTSSPSRPLTVYTSTAEDNNVLLKSGSANVYLTFADNGTTSQTGLSVRIGSSGNSMVFNTGGTTERVRIDSAGRVTMPYQPSFVAGFTGGGYVTVPDGNVIPFNYTGGSGAFDNGANFNTGTSRFTAPVTGRYFIQANGSAVSGGTRSIQIMKNGSAITNGADTMASFVSLTGNTVTAVMSLIVYLAAGDYVDARTRNGSIDIYRNHTWFLGHLIG